MRDIENALNAIVGSDRLGADLGRGELAGLDADDDTGADLFADLASSVAGPSTRDRKPHRVASAPPHPSASPSRRLVAAREKLDRQRSEAAESAERMRAAEHAVEDAEAATKRVERELAKARRELDAAQQARERLDAAVARSEEAVARLED